MSVQRASRTPIEQTIVSLRLPNTHRAIALLAALLLASALLIRWSAPAAATRTNDTPLLDLNGDATGVDFTVTFSEDEGPKPIVAIEGLTITYTGAQLTSARAKLLSRPDGALESLSVDLGATALSVKYEPGKGLLTVSGTGSVADYQQVLRTLVYDNTSQSPDTTDRLVEVAVSDGSTDSLPATATIFINAVNDAPVLDNTGNMVLPAIQEDDVNSGGGSVKGIIESAEQQGEDRITDVDEDALEGMAIIEAVSANGVWQYSLTAGANWLPFPAVSNTAAVLLNETSRIRFVPAAGYSGAASFSFRAWDQSAGRENGQTGIDVSINGGTTAFSAQSETVAIDIVAVNDLPVVDLNGPEDGTGFSAQFIGGGPAVAIADLDAAVSDADHTTLSTLTATLTIRPDGPAEWLAAATEGTGITAAPYDATTGRLVLSGSAPLATYGQVLRSITYQNSAGSPSTVARVVEVVAHDSVNSGNAAVSTIQVSPSNSAPVLVALSPISLGDVAEDTAQPGGMAIAPLLAKAGDPITDSDPGALEGIAVEAAAGTNGSWQFSLINPPSGATDWQPVGVVSTTMALLLPDTAWLRFVPAPDYSGPSGDLTFRAWDRTTGNAGQRVDASQNGGTSAFSSATGIVLATVTPLNDPPALSGLPAAPLAYVEDAAALPLMPGVIVSDVDNATLASATIRITNPLDGDAEWLQAVTTGTAITADYEGGLLQLTGVAAQAVYQQVLRSVTYLNTSQDPTADDRAIQITVSDALSSSVVYALSAQVQPVNDTPDLDLDGTTAGSDYETVFYINRAPVPIAPHLVLADRDNTTMRSASIRITNLRNGQAELLSIDVSGAVNIRRSYDPVTGILSLTGADSVAAYQQVMRTLTYDNALPQPDRVDRLIEFTVSDAGGPSVARQTRIQLLPAPTAYMLMPMVVRRGEEPNDTCIDAFRVSLNREDAFLPDDTVDWFYFDLTAAANVTVELRDFTPGRGQLNVATGNTACQQLQLIGTSGDPTPNKTVNLGRREAGRYYIRIIIDGPTSQTAAYRLAVRTTSP